MQRDLDTLLRYELADENYYAELEARKERDRQDAEPEQPEENE